MQVNLTKEELMFLFQQLDGITVKGFNTAQEYVAIGAFIQDCIKTDKSFDLDPTHMQYLMNLLEGVNVTGVKNVMTFAIIMDKLIKAVQGISIGSNDEQKQAKR
jgi:hypothetical protein